MAMSQRAASSGVGEVAAPGRAAREASAGKPIVSGASVSEASTRESNVDGASVRKPSVRERVHSAFADARHLWRSFTGEAAYDRYLERHARYHPEIPPMSQKEFWRDRSDWDERNVQARCC